MGVNLDVGKTSRLLLMFCFSVGVRRLAVWCCFVHETNLKIHAYQFSSIPLQIDDNQINYYSHELLKKLWANQLILLDWSRECKLGFRPLGFSLTSSDSRASLRLISSLSDRLCTNKGNQDHMRAMTTGIPVPGTSTKGRKSGNEWENKQNWLSSPCVVRIACMDNCRAMQSRLVLLLSIAIFSYILFIIRIKRIKWDLS